MEHLDDQGQGAPSAGVAPASSEPLGENQGDEAPGPDGPASTSSPGGPGGDEPRDGDAQRQGKEPAEDDESQGDDLDIRDQEIALRVAVGFTHAQTAEALGISVSTVSRRLKVQAMRDQMMEFRRQWLVFSTASLVGLAVAVLYESPGSEDEPVRLAPKAVLSQARPDGAEVK